jgi:hypothetical protein
MLRSIAILNIRARTKPVMRALFCFSLGSLFDTIDMNMILSIPSTISRKVSVSNATQLSGLRKISMFYWILLKRDQLKEHHQKQ